MRYLADTHLLIWSGFHPERLNKNAERLLKSRRDDVYFSAVSIWETAIKHALRKPEFNNPPDVFRRQLLMHGYRELTITSEHAIEVANLPAFHEDPFDRLLLAQARVEGMLLLTSDKALARYPGTLRV